MKGKMATDSWWIGSMSLLVISNLVLAYWFLAELFGWENGYAFGDFLYYITFFPARFLAPVAAFLGINAALDFMRAGNWRRSAILAFLSGGAALCAWIGWEAFLTAGRA